MTEQRNSEEAVRVSSTAVIDPKDNRNAPHACTDLGSTKPCAPEVNRKNKFVEGLLELGRNWAVAVALAAFGAASYHREAVTGAWQNKDLVLGTTVGFAIIWIAISILRFLDVVQAPTSGFRQTIKAWFAVTILVALGVGLVLQTASYADNAKIVAICSDYRSLPNSAAHNDELCQKLYKDRADKERSYMGQK